MFSCGWVSERIRRGRSGNQDDQGWKRYEEYTETLWVSCTHQFTWRATKLISYRTERLMTLLYFAQTLFLVFASVYIAKESIETILVGGGAHSHGGGHSHGHGGEQEHAHEEGHTEERSVCFIFG